MRFRIIGSLCKLLQRRTYTCLSSTFGTWCCVGGVLLLLISLIQFGEVLLQWSMQHYSKRYDGSFDNIAGESFKQRNCYNFPIDIVYTWVNGSDPRLISELNKAKSAYLSSCNASVLEEKKKELRYVWTDGKCPYKNCVPLSALTVSGLPPEMTLAELKKLSKLFQVAKSLDHKILGEPKLCAVYFPRGTDMRRLHNKTLKLNTNIQINTSQIFLTSTLEKGKKRLSTDAIILNAPDDFTEIEIKRALRLQNIIVRSINLYPSESLAHVVFNDENSARQALALKTGNITLDGGKITFLPAALCWQPILPEYTPVKENEDISASRFADNEELRYSLRSVEKYAPWVRNIYIVTNGQIPSWIDLENKRLKIVTHADIFSNKSHLPTFSSPAIETHIHKIEGLSKHFIYMNDDVFFGDNIWPDDFYTHDKGYKVYLTYPVPNCAEGCPASWVHDKYCDKACNVSECDWDGGDCSNSSVSLWQQSALRGLALQAQGGYCHKGCANNWVGDRYCDGQCNNADCGFDAGDCGLSKFGELYSVVLPTTNNSTLTIPDGITVFYVNLTNAFAQGSVSSADHDETLAIRTVILSHRFMILSLTLYKNVSRVSIPFHISGFKDLNHSQPFDAYFSISIDTAAEYLPPTQIPNKKDHSISPSIQTTSYPKSFYGGKGASFLELQAALHLWQNKSSLEESNEISKHLLNVTYENLEEILLNLNMTSFASVNMTILQTIPWLKNFLPNTNSSKENDYVFNGLQKIGRKTLSIKTANKIAAIKNHNAIQTNTNTLPNSMYKGKFSSGYNGFLPWERLSLLSNIEDLIKQNELSRSYQSGNLKGRRLMDSFADTLHHVGKIYNKAFGYQARKVPAHMPHFIDVDIINEMQSRFSKYFDITSSHQIRSSNDMQFAFSYQYFLMSMPGKMNVTELFMEFDTDMSGTLSERELRTVAARVSKLPLIESTMTAFEDLIKNCSNISCTGCTPVVTREFMVQCPNLLKELNNTLRDQKKYKFEILGEDSVAFKMLRGNASDILQQLDWVRKHKRKFVCLNDNIDHGRSDAKMLRAILKDFYHSFFPIPSQFELHPGYRNRFTNVDEWKKWEASQTNSGKSIYIFPILIVIIVIALLFWTRGLIFIKDIINYRVNKRGFLGRRFTGINSSSWI